MNIPQPRDQLRPNLSEQTHHACSPFHPQYVPANLIVPLHLICCLPPLCNTGTSSTNGLLITFLLHLKQHFRQNSHFALRVTRCTPGEYLLWRGSANVTISRSTSHLESDTVYYSIQHSRLNVPTQCALPSPLLIQCEMLLFPMLAVWKLFA